MHNRLPHAYPNLVLWVVKWRLTNLVHTKVSLWSNMQVVSHWHYECSVMRKYPLAPNRIKNHMKWIGEENTPNNNIEINVNIYFEWSFINDQHLLHHFRIVVVNIVWIRKPRRVNPFWQIISNSWREGHIFLIFIYKSLLSIYLKYIRWLFPLCMESCIYSIIMKHESNIEAYESSLKYYESIRLI